MINLRTYLLGATALIGILAATADVGAAEKKAAVLGAWGVETSAMDKAIKPGNDFFQFANGTWYKTAEIPADRSNIGSFIHLRILSENRMVELAAELRAKPAAALTPEEKKLRDFSDAYVDRAGIDAKGLAPFKQDLDLIAGLKTHADVARAMGTRRLSLSGPFGVGIDINDKKPDQYAVRAGHRGLGLPNRDYYLRDDKELAATREAYRKYLAEMFTLAGLSDAPARAAAVYDVEVRIAQDHWPNADRRDQDKTFNPMSFAELEKLAPQFPWKDYFTAAGIPTSAAKRDGGAAGGRLVIVAEKSAFPKLAEIFAATPVNVWRDYLTARYLRAFADVMPAVFDDRNFAFYGTVIQGTAKQLPRDVRAAHVLDDKLGEALGKLYAAKYFPPEAKQKAQVLVDNLLKVYDTSIRTLPWMTEATRKNALEKLHKFTPYIGYPDTWRDYSSYKIARDDLLGNMQRGTEFEWNRNLTRLDNPVVKSEWEMTPPTVNAYYTPSFNAIYFPAAILQPPFFDPNADDAVNYGGIGAVIGHEVSHGFDDQGSKFDGDGRYENWWTEADRKAFEERATALTKQYDTFEPLPGLHVNGEFTLGENIADLSGLAIALKAYHLSLGGKPAPVIDGYTGDQRFFLGFGQIWRMKQREGNLRQQLLSDPHSPPMFRSIGATRNIDAWYEAFGVKPGEKYHLAPADRVRIW